MGKDRNRRQTPMNIPMCVACVLLCLTLISIHMTGNMYAKYTASAEGGDAAQVAKFDVSAVKINYEDSQTIDLSKATEEQSVSWSFTVTNNSQVAATDIVTITLPEELPGGITMKASVDGDQITESKSGNTYTYTEEFSAISTHNWEITFTGDPNATDLLTTETTLSDINLKVDVIQKD